MSLFLPLSSEQYHAKPMAISSITSPVGVHTSDSYLNRCQSPLSSSSSNSDTVSPPPPSSKSGSSSPHCRSFSNYSATSSTSSFPSSHNKPPHAQSSYYPYHPCAQEPSSEDGSTTGGIEGGGAPLSLHERRLRNKTASAKYRAKKNQQHGEMRSMIASLTKENELLLRQLDHVQHENAHLKTTCDRLRGKIMAQKMLKQYLVEAEQQVAPGNSTIENCYLHYPTSGASTMNHRKFTEDQEKKTWDKRDK